MTYTKPWEYSSGYTFTLDEFQRLFEKPHTYQVYPFGSTNRTPYIPLSPSQIHVTTFVGYVRELEEAWHGRDADDPAFGVSLAVGVVTTLLGPPEVSGAMDEKEALERPEEEGLDPQWLQLKWGVAVVSRAFDVWAAFEHGLPQEDVVRNGRNLL